MKFMPALPLIKKAIENGYAVPSFCVWNAETMDTVLRVASDCRAPVMLMNGKDEFDLLSPEQMAATARAVADRYDIPVALHLDHGDSLSRVEQCLAAGYTSVMLDFSSRPFAENVEALRQVVHQARPLGITVEGEIGAVGKVDEVIGEGSNCGSLTDSKEAKAFVEQTDIDMVAVSIGNAHGNYPRRPHLDFKLLARLREVIAIPIVLHGGSKTPEEDIRKVISLGIAKINVASELIRVVRESLLEQWDNKEGLWVPRGFNKAMEAMASVVEKWIWRTDAAAKA